MGSGGDGADRGGVGLKSVNPRGGENLLEMKRGGVGQAGRCKISIPGVYILRGFSKLVMPSKMSKIPLIKLCNPYS